MNGSPFVGESVALTSHLIPSENRMSNVAQPNFSLASGLCSSPSLRPPYGGLSIAASLDMEYNKLLQHRARLEQQANLQFFSGSNELPVSASKDFLSGKRPLIRGGYPSQSQRHAREELQSKKQKLDVTESAKDQTNQAKYTEVPSKVAAVANLRPSERKASFPLPTLRNKGSVQHLRPGSLRCFRETWEDLNIKIGKKLSGEEKEDFVVELFRRRLRTQNSYESMYRKAHNLVSPDKLPLTPTRI